MHAYPSLIIYLVHIQSYCIMISFPPYLVYMYIAHFPYNSFSKFDHIDSYKVYANCIPTDIESRLLRRPYSHISCKPDVYLPLCITPIPIPFESLCTHVFLVKYFYFHDLSWLVVLRINVDLAIFQPYLDLEAGDNQSLKIQVARPGIEPRSSCSASQELNHSATTAPHDLSW